RKGEKLSENKMDRWDKIVRSATQQSGRGDLMKIHAPITADKISGLINRNGGHAGLFAYEGSAIPERGIQTQSIKDYVTDMKTTHPQGLTDIWMIVGSEGGFSVQEVQQFSDLGLHPVTLGSQVL